MTLHPYWTAAVLLVLVLLASLALPPLAGAVPPPGPVSAGPVLSWTGPGGCQPAAPGLQKPCRIEGNNNRR
ncbi:hypothetical protein [Pseudodesulfovibrio indicus]|uniref:Uncharacterized protein n=1 Tax=Pseudodesulfovibrio indicus TaxID=1716143 RepID=A0A140D935_9BACT|nr:hypothetical protein [Pseudodesulfovibrio indicus]AMK09702.1 hypothetical protein AWY79_00560 [Pseudodesulfovibrio indicus]TDT86341.1 hypothetical protein EDC59_11315 [Pseudodesulfovibrio indicus]